MGKNLSLHCGTRLEKYIVDIWEDTVANQVGIHYLFRFSNNYGASVVKAYGCHGYEQDQWELACTLFYDDDSKIINPDDEYILIYPYDIMHGSDVLGNLKDKDVRRILYKIMKLED